MIKRSVVQKIARWWWIMLIVLAITIGATAYLTFRQIPVYRATTTYVTKLTEGITERRDIDSALDTLNRENVFLVTFSEVAMSRTIKASAAQRLGISNDEYRAMSVRSRVITGTNLLEVSVEGENPTAVSDFANTIGGMTAEYVNSLYINYQLVQLDQAETPGRPISPNVALNLILGAILGLFFGFIALLTSAWISGAFREPATDELADTRTIMPIAQEIEELKQQVVGFRKDLTEARMVFHDTLLDARALSDVLHEENGQKKGRSRLKEDTSQ